MKSAELTGISDYEHTHAHLVQNTVLIAGYAAVWVLKSFRVNVHFHLCIHLHTITIIAKMHACTI